MNPLYPIFVSTPRQYPAVIPLVLTLLLIIVAAAPWPRSGLLLLFYVYALFSAKALMQTYRGVQQYVGHAWAWSLGTWMGFAYYFQFLDPSAPLALKTHGVCLWLFLASSAYALLEAKGERSLN
jgi:hypothetical protein